MVDYIKVKFPPPAKVNIVTLRQEVAHAASTNRQIFQAALQNYDQLLKLALQVYGIKGKEYRYIKNNGIPRPPDLYRQLVRCENKYHQWLYKDAQRKARNRQKKEYRQRVRDAALKLEMAGFVPYKDFSMNLTAVERVNELLEEHEPGKWRRKDGVNGTHTRAARPGARSAQLHVPR